MRVKEEKRRGRQRDEHEVVWVEKLWQDFSKSKSLDALKSLCQQFDITSATEQKDLLQSVKDISSFVIHPWDPPRPGNYVLGVYSGKDFKYRAIFKPSLYRINQDLLLQRFAEIVGLSNIVVPVIPFVIDFSKVKYEKSYAPKVSKKRDEYSSSVKKFCIFNLASDKSISISTTINQGKILGSYQPFVDEQRDLLPINQAKILLLAYLVGLRDLSDNDVVGSRIVDHEDYGTIYKNQPDRPNVNLPILELWKDVELSSKDLLQLNKIFSQLNIKETVKKVRGLKPAILVEDDKDVPAGLYRLASFKVEAYKDKYQRLSLDEIKAAFIERLHMVVRFLASFKGHYADASFKIRLADFYCQLDSRYHNEVHLFDQCQQFVRPFSPFERAGSACLSPRNLLIKHQADILLQLNYVEKWLVEVNAAVDFLVHQASVGIGSVSDDYGELSCRRLEDLFDGWEELCSSTDIDPGFKEFSEHAAEELLKRCNYLLEQAQENFLAFEDGDRLCVDANSDDAGDGSDEEDEMALLFASPLDFGNDKEASFGAVGKSDALYKYNTDQAEQKKKNESNELCQELKGQFQKLGEIIDASRAHLKKVPVDFDKSILKPVELGRSYSAPTEGRREKKRSDSDDNASPSSCDSLPSLLESRSIVFSPLALPTGGGGGKLLSVSSKTGHTLFTDDAGVKSGLPKPLAKRSDIKSAGRLKCDGDALKTGTKMSSP